MEYEEREKLKSEAWGIINDCHATTDQKAIAYSNGVITAHYWRAREALDARKDKRTFLRKIIGKNYCKGYELDIDTYTRHWLGANPKSVKNGDVFRLLCIWFPPISNKYLKGGWTDYQEFGSGYY